MTGKYMDTKRKNYYSLSGAFDNLKGYLQSISLAIGASCILFYQKGTKVFWDGPAIQSKCQLNA